MIPGMFKALWHYRHFVLSSIRNEYRTRFARSAFGGLWAILNPLAEVAIYALILSNILSARFEGIDNPYSFAIYLTSGILAWNLFSQTINRCLGLFIANGNLIKKVMFPKVVLPATVTGTALVDNVMLLIAILVIFALLGHSPDVYILWLPVLMAATLMLAIGIGLIVGILNVFMRDIGQVVPIVLQFGFWLTPIVYPINIIPESWRHWLLLNPMYPIVEAYHSVLAFNEPPDMWAVGVIAIGSVFLLAFSFFLFMRSSEEMADAL